MAPIVFTTTCLWVGASQLKTPTHIRERQLETAPLSLPIASREQQTECSTRNFIFSDFVNSASCIPDVHKNLQTNKQIHEMCPKGRKIDQINLKMVS